MGALAGVSVLELGPGLATAYCTRLLGDLGADVVKVEPPGGDPSRGEGPLVDGAGAVFHYLNANKRGVSLDLAAPEDVALLHRLVVQTTIIVEGLGPGELEGQGIDLRSLESANPRIVVVRISPFGQRGSGCTEPATSLTLQAAAGWVNDRGVPGLPPVQVGGRLDQYVVGCYAACAALTGLAAGRVQERPVEVDVSAFLCIHNTMPYPGLLRLTLEQLGWGDFKATTTPLGIQPCRDGFVGINILTAQQWSDACSLLEVPQFVDQQDQLKRDDDLLDEFRRLVRHWLSKRDAEEVIELFQACRIPATPVGTGQSMPRYSHWQERPFFSDAASPGGAFRHPGFPWRMSGTPPSIVRTAPRLGQHTDEVLAGLAHGMADVVADGMAPSAAPGTDVRDDGTDDATLLPFAGLRVLDLGVFWAAPYLTCFLGAMGADVVKVESLRRPDPFRFSMAFPQLAEEWWECSPLWQGPNFNKRALTLDLTDPEGQAQFLRLVARADVLVENFSARVVGQLGLGYEEIREINPSIVMLRMPGFGIDGPWCDYVGWGNAFEQVAGQCQVTGYLDGEPQNPGGYADPTAAFHAGVALLAALEHRRRTGEGQLIEVSQIEVAACTTAEQVIVHSVTGEVQGREGNRSPSLAPQGVYPCDGGREHVALSVRDDDDWSRFRQALDDPTWAGRPAWECTAGRLADHDAIDDHIATWTSSRSAAEVVARLRSVGVPVAPLFSVDGIYAHPQVRAYHYYEEHTHPLTGPRPYPGWPMRFSTGPARAHRWPAPRLGQHNDEILTELGLCSAEIAGLRSRGVVGVLPLGV